MPTEELDRALTAALARVDEPDVEAARGRLHRRIRRRRMMTSLAILPMLAAVIAVSVVVTSAGTHSQRVVTGPATTTPPIGGLAPLPVKMIAGPPGWQPVDYGNARVWVPGDWKISPPGFGECGASYVKEVFIDPPAEKCAQQIAPNAAFITIHTLTSVAETGPTRTINGYQVIVPDTPPLFLVPQLGVSLFIQTNESLREEILATVGPSSRAAVLAPGAAPPPPSDWQTVTYSGLTVRVPPSWPVADINSTSTFDECHQIFHQSSVVLGSPPVFPPCPTWGVVAPGDGIWLTTGSTGFNGPTPEHSLSLHNGLRTQVFDPSEANTFVIDIDANPVEIILGLGVDPTIARTILYALATASAHTSGTSEPTTVVQPQPTGSPSPCRGENLSATYDWEGATGSLLGTVRFTNRGPGTCSLGGYLAVKVIGRDDAVLPVTEQRAAPVPTTQSPPVLLGVNVTGAAAAQVQWREWCLPTKPTPVTLAVTLPDGSVLSAPYLGPNTPDQTPRCDAPNLPSTLGVGPVLPGTY